MLYKRICMILCVLLACLSITLRMQAFAVLPDDEEISSLFDNISLEVIKDEPSVGPIICFDVSAEGQVALGLNSNHSKTIAVYSEGGEFLYGYTFECYGSYYVFWEQDNVCIYLVRGEIALVVDKEGNGIAVNRAVDSDHLKVINSTSKEVDGVCYYLERDIMIGEQYGRLSVQKPDGTKFVFYDASESHNTRVILTIIVVALFVSVVLIGVIKQERKKLSTP